jgi:ABC-2 type transport system ATP-binding protein
MNQLTKHFDEVHDLLRFGDYGIATKRIIDFTLDTEDIAFYTKTNSLLNWLDSNSSQEEVKNRLFELLEELQKALSEKTVKPKTKILDAAAIRKTYDKSSFALGPVSLELYEGDIIGLVGENGNGKTTLLRLLCGELFTTEGTIQYNFEYEDLYDLRTKLVYIPQRTDTWRGSMYENLVFTAACYGYTPQENNLVVELIIARLGLRKFRQHSWKSLSSGYKMRFELARMLLRKPKVLLIDEPLANLDILAQQTVLEDFRAIAKSPFRPIGIVLSSQQLYEVEKTSDQVIFLKQGVQKNLWDNKKEKQEAALVLEIETTCTQSELNDALSTLGIISLQFNGGTYIATFTAGNTVNDFLKTVIDKEIPLVYFRDISNSTRRFFVS